MDDRIRIMTDFMANQSPARVPVGFWYHFVSPQDHHRGLSDAAVLPAVLAAQKAFIADLQPDMVKIMSDGFFGHPALLDKRIQIVSDLAQIRAVGPEHPWILEQVDYVRAICDFAGRQVFMFYNIFSPLQYIRLKFEEYDADFSSFTRLFFEAPEAMVAAASEIEKDLRVLIDRLFTQSSLDGVYYSVQSVQGEAADEAFHQSYVKPSDLSLLGYINDYTQSVMLHICGYDRYSNDLKRYTDYPAAIFNWATATEGVSLKQGKAHFGGKPVLGGFDNNPGSILYEGDEDALRRYIFDLLDEAGTAGVALGADCTIQSNISGERLSMVRRLAAEYGQR